MKYLTFSTGNLYKEMPPYDIDGCISFLRGLDLDIDGYMLSLMVYDDLNVLKLSDSTLKYLNGMRFNSIHAPVVDFSRDEKTRVLLNQLKELYDDVGAKQIVFHPYRIKDSSVLKDIRMKCAIEFMRPQKNIELRYYDSLLKKHKWLYFAQDICHAAQFSNDSIKKAFSMFKDRTSQVHISFADKGGFHRPMYEADRDFLDAAECMKNLEVEFCIEANISKPEEIKKEAAFCRKWLNNEV